MANTQPSPVAVAYDGPEGIDFASLTHQHGMPPALPRYAPAVIALVDGATITLDASLGNDFRVTLAGNRTLTIENARDGQEITVHVTQDATGTRTLAYDVTADWGTAGAPTLTTTAGKTDVLKFVWNATIGKALGLQALKGY